MTLRLLALAAVCAAVSVAAPPCRPGIGGRVLEHKPAGEGEPEGIGGFRIVVTGEGQRLELETRSDGQFFFPELAPGSYRIAADRPGYTVTSQLYEPVRLAAAGCPQVNIDVETERRVHGRLTGPDGEKLGGVRVMMIQVGLLSQPNAMRLPSAYTDPNGAFDMKRILPGEYYLGVNLDQPPSPSFPYQRFLYPGTDDPAMAEPIRIREEGTSLELDLRLPSKPEPKTLAGVAVWPDGKPAAGAHVYLEDPRFPNEVNRVRATVDEQGFFTFPCYDGTRYLLHVVSECREMADCKSATPQEIAPGVNPSLRMVLDQPGHSSMDAFKRSLPPGN